jgi:hypothetical protein
MSYGDGETEVDGETDGVEDTDGVGDAEAEGEGETVGEGAGGLPICCSIIAPPFGARSTHEAAHRRPVNSDVADQKNDVRFAPIRTASRGTSTPAPRLPERHADSCRRCCSCPSNRRRNKSPIIDRPSERTATT